MFKIGEFVLYGAEGVCKIVGIEELDLTGETSSYYRLASENDRTSTIFVPIANSILTERIKPLLSEEEIRALLADTSEVEPIFCDSTNLRKSRYHEIVNSADRKRMLALVRELHARRNSIKGTGQRFSITDDHYYKLAQRILFDEFSRVIPISQSEFLDFITKTE